MWSRRDWFWERGFAALKVFKTREGHCHVPALHIEGDLKLGYRVSTQRRKKNIMSKERKQRLNKVPLCFNRVSKVIFCLMSALGQ